jgi:hypothetical protein
MMTEENGRPEQMTKWIRRIARIWSIPIILYALLMFIGYTWSWVTTGVADPYAVEGTTLVDALPPIFLFLSVIGLVIAWRWEGLGGAVSLIFLLVTLILLVVQSPINDDNPLSMIPYLLVVVVLVPVILFLVYFSRTRQMLTA